MRLNRYKLKNHVRKGNKPAKILEKLLKEPEKLIGLICLGVNLVNFTAAALVTIIALKLGGEPYVAIATLILTVVVLIFCEAAPKTLAAIYPEKLAFPSAFIYYPLMLISYPMVWLISETSNLILWLIGFRQKNNNENSLSNDELRTIVREAGTLISRKYRSMLLNILDLEKMSVDDVMVPHTEISGINMEDNIEDIRKTIQNSEHTLLPVFSENINNIFGILHLRKLANLSSKNLFEKNDVERLSSEPYFIQEGTSLNTQLIEFQRIKQRIAIVVDEYGGTSGIITLEDVIEEIFGEISGEFDEEDNLFSKLDDFTFIFDSKINLQDFYRAINLKDSTSFEEIALEIETLGGFLIEKVKKIPRVGQVIIHDSYKFIVEIVDKKRIKQVKLIIPKDK